MDQAKRLTRSNGGVDLERVASDVRLHDGAQKKRPLPEGRQVIWKRECAVQSGLDAQHRCSKFVPDKSFPRLVILQPKIEGRAKRGEATDAKSWGAVTRALCMGGIMGTDNQRLPGLQAGRAIAALTVAYFHSYIALRAFPESAQVPIVPLKDYGYLGVNFFFAISGYVICLIASKPTFSAGSFAINRAFRLFPMYWVAMGAVAFLIVIGKYRPEPLGHFLYSMTLLPQSGESAYDVSWTLERELVFYMIAACVMPLGGVRALAVVLASLGFAGWYFRNPWSYHLVSTTHLDFLAGVIVFLIQDQAKRAGAIAPLVIGVALLVYTRAHDFTASVSTSMGFILLGIINLHLPWDKRPFNWLVQAGNASYSIYLLHYLTFVTMVYIAARMGLPVWMCEPWRYATLLLCCLVSIMTWRVIELPMIAWGHQLSRTTKHLNRRKSAYPVSIDAVDTPAPDLPPRRA
jgi:peptidoglycan/LPS O-acetylase OafA/YrhL